MRWSSRRDCSLRAGTAISVSSRKSRESVSVQTCCSVIGNQFTRLITDPRATLPYGVITDSPGSGEGLTCNASPRTCVHNKINELARHINHTLNIGAIQMLPHGRTRQSQLFRASLLDAGGNLDPISHFAVHLHHQGQLLLSCQAVVP